MTITTSWEVTNLYRELHDGYVYEARWTLTATAPDPGPDGEPITAEIVGSTKLPRPAGAFIPYDDLTPGLCEQWVKDRIGERGVSDLEKQVTLDCANRVAPQTGDGTPW